jgi:predicted component of type VI protein secretion system
LNDLVHQHFLQRADWCEAGVKFSAQFFEFMRRLAQLLPAHHHGLGQQAMLERVLFGNRLALRCFRAGGFLRVLPVGGELFE